MAKQTINLGNTVNDGTGDALRVGAQKINANFTELYNLLGGDNIQVVSSITVGTGLVASSSSGEVTITAQQASSETSGVVKIGSGLSIDSEGVLSTPTYVLPKAATNILGGIKVGNNLTIDNDGVLSAATQTYTLPTASISTLGGIRIGSGLEIEDGVVSVITSEVASALISGPVSVALTDSGANGELLSSGSLTIATNGSGKSISLSVQTDEEDTNPVNRVIVNSTGVTINATDESGTQISNWIFNNAGEIVASPLVLKSLTDISILSNNGDNQWEFLENGTLSVPASIQLNGDTAELSLIIDGLLDDVGIKQQELSVIQQSISTKLSELGYWQSIASQGPSNPEYSFALSEINRLQGEISSLQNQLSIVQGELSAINSELSSAQGLLANPFTTLTYIAEDGVLNISRGAVQFPDGSVQTTAYLGDTIDDIEIPRLVNDTATVTLSTDGTLTIPGSIGSLTAISLSSGTDTSIVAGTDLKLFADGLFALRNYSTTDSIAITVNFNDASQKSWTFNNNGSVTFPDTTVQTTAYVSNITNQADDSSSILAAGSTMTRDSLKVRITVVNDSEVAVEFNYVNQDTTVTISGSNGTTNFFNGSTTVDPGNVLYYPITTTPLTQVGDIVTAIIADHSFGKMYRVTAMYRDIPDESTLASVYCTIEQLR
jgi:hypothetical protein